MHVQYIWTIIREWTEMVGISTTVTGKNLCLPTGEGNKKPPNDSAAEISLRE